jgi:hypothetical protein
LVQLWMRVLVMLCCVGYKAKFRGRTSPTSQPGSHTKSPPPLWWNLRTLLLKPSNCPFCCFFRFVFIIHLIVFVLDFCVWEECVCVCVCALTFFSSF